MVWVVLYAATIFAANGAIAAFGVVPVGFGLMAPAGVYFAGLTFTFRDLTQEKTLLAVPFFWALRGRLVGREAA